MRFNATVNVNFSQWRDVTMARESAEQELAKLPDDEPKSSNPAEIEPKDDEIIKRKYSSKSKKKQPGKSTLHFGCWR